MKTYIQVALVALLSLAFNVQAETSVVLGGFSHHTMGKEYTYKGERGTYNEVNPAIGFQDDDIRWVLYSNSYKKPSVAFLWVPKMELNEHFSIAPRLGLTTGYEDTPEELLLAPVVGAELDIQNNGLHIVPAIQAPGVFTLHIQLDY